MTTRRIGTMARRTPRGTVTTSLITVVVGSTGASVESFP